MKLPPPLRHSRVGILHNNGGQGIFFPAGRLPETQRTRGTKEPELDSHLLSVPSNREPSCLWRGSRPRADKRSDHEDRSAAGAFRRWVPPAVPRTKRKSSGLARRRGRRPRYGSARLQSFPASWATTSPLTCPRIHSLRFGEWPSASQGGRPGRQYGALPRPATRVRRTRRAALAVLRLRSRP